MEGDIFKDAKEKLKEGGIGVLLTDTLYGVVGCALGKAAVELVYKAKEREPEKPFIILISDLEDIKQFGVRISAHDKEKLNEWWPGSVSVILPCSEEQYTYLHRGTHALAFRLPDDAVLRALLSETGPLVAPSANTAGKQPAETIKEARAYFGDAVDFYIDAGNVTGEPSTLIDMTGDELVVLRGTLNGNI